MIYPIYYKKELCCSQVEYKMRTSDVSAVFVKTQNGKEVQRSVVTLPTKEEFDAHLHGFVPVVEKDTNGVFGG